MITAPGRLHPRGRAATITDKESRRKDMVTSAYAIPCPGMKNTGAYIRPEYPASALSPRRSPGSTALTQDNVEWIHRQTRCYRKQWKIHSSPRHSAALDRADAVTAPPSDYVKTVRVHDPRGTSTFRLHLPRPAPDRNFPPVSQVIVTED